MARPLFLPAAYRAEYDFSCGQPFLRMVQWSQKQAGARAGQRRTPDRKRTEAYSMKALLIGGTGQISMAITKKLVKDGWGV